jgi:hypothetical protein
LISQSRGLGDVYKRQTKRVSEAAAPISSKPRPTVAIAEPTNPFPKK